MGLPAARADASRGRGAACAVVGALVLARYGGGRRAYRARVLAVVAGGARVDLEYEDGDREAAVALDLLRESPARLTAPRRRRAASPLPVALAAVALRAPRAKSAHTAAAAHR